MPLKQKTCLGGALLAGVVFCAGDVFAQQVDYKGLSELFAEPVTVSATGKPQRASETPVALEIITADQIRRMGVSSIPEVLDRVNGITNWRSMRSFSDVGIRGQNASYNATLLVLVNGRQVYIDSFGYTDWTLIPVQLEEIRQIEVIKNPATALYGFNAASGVVNIITYNPKYDKNGEAGVTAGTGNYERAHAYKNFELSDRANVRVSSSIEAFDEFDRVSKTVYAKTGAFREDNRDRKLMADGVFQLTDGTQLRLESSYADALAADPVAVYTSQTTDKQIWSAKAALSSDTNWGLVEGNVYTNVYRGDYGESIPAIIDNQVMVSQLRDTFRLGAANTFRVEGEYRHNQMKSDAFVKQNSTIAYDVFAASGMWDVALSPTIEWNNGLRLDYLTLDRDGPLPVGVPFTSNDAFDQSITGLGFNSGVTWKVTDRDSLRAFYGRGLQIPSLLELSMMYTGFPGLVVAGDPTLNPIAMDHYEVGYNRSIEPLNGKFHSSLFYKKATGINIIATRMEFQPTGLILRAADVGDSQTAGLELGLDGKIGDHWAWDAGYMYQNSVDNMIPAATQLPTLVSVQYNDAISHHTFKGHVGYTSGNWEADLFGAYASSFKTIVFHNLFYDFMNQDPYYTLGGRVGYTFNNDITLALSGSNLQSARTTANFGLETERQLFLSVTRPF